MTQVRQHLDDEAIRGRMREGLEGRPLKWLAEATGTSYKSVQRYLGEGQEQSALPAEFVARYVDAVPVAADWVLRGELPKRRRPPGEAERRLDMVDRALRERLGDDGER